MSSLVSIIIPTYNRAHLIGETLDSIVAQTYPNWECIIVDDGSTDDTATLIAEYILKDNRFKYYTRPEDRLKGANACRNYGFELSNGEFIKWFDSDDIMHPQFLEKQVEVLEHNLALDFCASFSKCFKERVDNLSGSFIPEHKTESKAIYNFILGKLYFLTPSTLWRKSKIQGKILFDEELYNAHETDFNFRRLIEGLRFFYLQEVLFYVRRGHQSIESESINNFLSLESQFIYFQKVFDYLNSKKVSNDLEFTVLKKYVIYRQVFFYYAIRRLVVYSKSARLFKIIISNILKSNINFCSSLRLIFGLLSINFFKKGYSLIHLKEFDIR